MLGNFNSLSLEDETEETVGQSSNIFVLCKINNPVKYMLKFFIIVKVACIEV